MPLSHVVIAISVEIVHVSLLLVRYHMRTFSAIRNNLHQHVLSAEFHVMASISQNFRVM